MYNQKDADFFLKKINRFVADQLADYIPQRSGDKTIHDPIWGSVLYYRWEIQLIDLPIFQRLRGISQLGMANLTYPAAHHTRYEHSLGTAAIASRMIGKLRDRYAFSEKAAGFEITVADIYKIRLTALLHDIGHCVYSHLSERIYGNMPEFKNIMQYIKEESSQNISPKPHEVFSYLILTSPSFCSFFYKHIDYPKKGALKNCRMLLQEIANMVIGIDNFINKDGRLVCRSFLTDIINSDFDADKLDYTQRDSYTAGIALTYGVERFLMKLVIAKQETPDYTDLRLAVTADALTTVEELIFNRKVLYVYMYRHQKVISTESVIEDILYGIVKLGYIRHPCDFLYLTDFDVNQYSQLDAVPFPEYAPERKMSGFQKIIKNRATPKRCLTISKSNLTLKNAESVMSEAFHKTVAALDRAQAEDRKMAILQEFAANYPTFLPENLLIEKINAVFAPLGREDYETSLQRRNRFYEILVEKYKERGMAADFDLFDLHIALSPVPKDKTVLPLTELGSTYGTDHIPYVKQWSNAFSWDKWKSYFFVSPHIDKNVAAEAAISFLEELTGDILVRTSAGKA